MPPTNVGGEALWDLRRHVREVATSSRPFEARLGPGATFAPRNPTLHLEVHADELDELRRRLRSGPLGRPDEHPFVAHLTLRRRAAPDAVARVRAVLPGAIGPWWVDRFVVMEQCHGTEGTRWRAVWEEPLGPAVVVGRGGVELVLRRTRLDEPLGDPFDAASEAVTSPAREPLVVVAESSGAPGVVLGRAVGRVADDVARLDLVEVDPAQRGRGIASKVLERWCADALAAGAATVVADSPLPGLLDRHGFVRAGDVAVRRLDPSR